jgi:hypothetical protein
MARFIVTTDERVSGHYRVYAEDEKAAREKFIQKYGETSLIDWRDVHQINYMAYDVEVEKVEQCP